MVASRPVNIQDLATLAEVDGWVSFHLSEVFALRLIRLRRWRLQPKAAAAPKRGRGPGTGVVGPDEGRLATRKPRSGPERLEPALKRSEEDKRVLGCCTSVRRGTPDQKNHYY